mgnify:FL=1
MSTEKQTVTINGKTYDVTTGKPSAAPSKAPVKARMINDIAPNKNGILAQPVKKPAATHRVPATLSQKSRPIAPHARPSLQKSTTLRRDVLKKPTSKVRPSAHKIHQRVQKSERITRFAPIRPPKTTESKIDHDLAAQTKALQAAQAEYMAKANQNNTHISSRVIKEHLLGQAIDKVPVDDTKHAHKSHTAKAPKRSRFASVAVTSFALVLLGGYLTYINIPNLSIRIAAANSGIDANLPTYQPSGYRISGPISYNDGEVNVKYKSGSGNTGYQLTQRPSDWDPIAALDNYVESDSDSDYQIHSVQGLTVYTYDKKAVWVNGGILHILDGNAPLSNQQVESIVASM